MAMAAGPALLLVAVRAWGTPRIPRSSLWGGLLAILCLVQKLIAHVGSTLMFLQALSCSESSTPLPFFFFFSLKESLSCGTGCRYAFVSFSHHLLLVGLLNCSAL